jgi:hypothetical protein
MEISTNAFTLIKATESAAAYLTDAYAEFGNWTLAAVGIQCRVCNESSLPWRKQQTNVLL